jgi:hypothetical protein
VGRPFVLAISLGAAAAAGVTVGGLSAAPQRAPEPTAAVAAIPTSTPDTRTPLPTRTLTPTQAPTPSPTHAPIVQTKPAPAEHAVPTFIATPRPTPTPEPRGRAVVFFASRQGIPVAVDEPKAAGGQSVSDRVFFRFAALKTTKAAGPPAYVNLFPTMKATFVETTVLERGVVAIGFIVGQMYGDWGVPPDDVKLLLQQIVYTATEEPGIDRVLITQNGGKPAVINGKTYDKPLAREDVR